MSLFFSNYSLLFSAGFSKAVGPVGEGRVTALPLLGRIFGFNKNLLKMML